MLLFRSCLACWVLLLMLLSGCQSDGPTPAGITADNYLSAIPDPKTLGESYVSDPDQILQPGTTAALNARLDSLDHSGRAHIDVVLVRSLGEAVPKTAAYELFNKWKVGSKSTNNGLLMLVVLDQRRVEFETGYGLEADLPDIICYRIQQRYMVEPARAGNYDLAVQQGVAALIRRLRPTLALPKPALRTAEDSSRYYVDSLQHALKAQYGLLPAEDPLVTVLPSESLADNYSPPGPGAPVGILVAAFLALVLYLVLWYRTTQGMQGRGWLIIVPICLFVSLLIASLSCGAANTTGTFVALAYGLPWLYLHGYFGWYYRRAQRAVLPSERPATYEQWQRAHRGLAFTAYLFPVALALYWPWYRRYLAALRDTPFACPECSQLMHRLDSTAEKQHLGPGQQVEETSRAIDYDVWACPTGHYVPLAYLNLDSDAKVCPACHHRTLSPGRLRVEKVATRHTEGRGWRVEKCRFCQHEEKTKETIPRLPDPTQRAAASSSSSSWGSSSSSSSGSRSTSSGGSSGGGGAGSSW
ncbi:TPM domain-containing protein [Hymenobacter aerilatus]|uniref:TPM domain-containing protein n=1 Tax=Hymenobacter aerilatus TaxID=2932251 RepID=A0A8T9SZS0_9BACT|nr:TPM domain-containing protein [Hymenobacter aerilatus]UOR07375.1 TPM domain-containing protein [Hymenobacter aerilatus]